MAGLADISNAGRMFLLGNHGCCGVPGIEDHSRIGLERSWGLGQGSLVDLALNRKDQVVLSHDFGDSSIPKDALLFEAVAVWAASEKAFLCLNFSQGGHTGEKCAARAVKIAAAQGLDFAVCSKDGRILDAIGSQPNDFDKVYFAGGCIGSSDANIVDEAVKLRCLGIIADCRDGNCEWVEDLLKKNKRRKKNRMVYMAHIGSEFELAPWCAQMGIGCVCDDPLEALDAILKCNY